MREKSKLTEMLMAFFICTTCITILEGFLGMLFFKDLPLNYQAFFSPPLFGLISVLFGVVNISKKELTIKQMIGRRAIHLLLIEVMVLGTNYRAGNSYTPLITIAIAIGIAVIFVLVHVVLWISDTRSANKFNEKLKEFQRDSSKL